jgi:hypothetical protein
VTALLYAPISYPMILPTNIRSHPLSRASPGKRSKSSLDASPAVIMFAFVVLCEIPGRFGVVIFDFHFLLFIYYLAMRRS